MKLKTLRVEGFRSFVNPQELKLDTVPPGLYLVAGVNTLEPELEGNGAGKSSLFEAVFWALFGKTSRNLKAGSIRTWGGKSCNVSLAFEGVTVSRSSSPNELLLNDSSVEQATLEKELGFSPEVALNTMYLAQFSDFFLDLTTTARMEIYSAALGLGLWEEKSDQAKELAKATAQEVQQLTVEHARLEAKAETLQNLTYEKALQHWQDEQAKKIRAADKTIGNLDLEIDTLARKHEISATTLATAQRKHSAHQQTVAKLSDTLQAAQLEEARAEAECNALNKQVVAATGELSKFKRLGKGECIECGQGIGDTHKKKHTQHLQDRVLNLTRKAEEQGSTFLLARKQREKASEAIAMLSQPTPINELLVEKHGIENSLAATNKSKFNAAQALGALKKEVNPFIAQVEASRKEAQAVSDKAKAKGKEVKESRGLQARFEFWIKGFKDVRYQVMQESLAQLNAETNECLHQLGLADWALEFSVEKENKSGTVKRGFLCEVQSPYTEESMPWEVWSGGESQRLRLATQLGVANMLCSRLGLDFDFEFWDEPTSNLSLGGIKELLAVLSDRAERYGRRIFLADHRAMDFPFDGVLNITKTEEGSQLGELECSQIF